MELKMMDDSFFNKTIKKKVTHTKTNSTLSYKDILGGLSVRLGFNRDEYKVDPGIYALGNPTELSDVVVTANYKLSFDILRKECNGLNLWILVLDTKGINVWCAAGKGTFGTNELVRRIRSVALKEIVNHNRVILPQLGAVGVAAHKVKQATGFNPLYGPVRASDIKNYIKNNYSKTKDESRVKFDLKDRLVVIPVELKHTFKPALYIFLTIMFLKVLGSMSLEVTIKEIFFEFLPFIISILIGTIAVPILLPFIPFRIFAIKGALLGGVFSLIYSLFTHDLTIYNLLMSFLLFTPIVTYLSMNFTGSTTFTTLKGVKLEVKYSIPIIIISFITGAVMRLFY